MNGNCDVCGRTYTWGCGHSGSQEWAARRHKATQKHKTGACDCTNAFGRKHDSKGALLP